MDLREKSVNITELWSVTEVPLFQTKWNRTEKNRIDLLINI